MNTSTTPAISIEEALQAQAAVKQAIDALGQRGMDLNSELAQLKERQQALWTGPIRRDEAKGFLLTLIDQLGESFPRDADWAGLFKSVSAPQGYRPLLSGGAFQPHPAKRQGPLCMADIITLPGVTGPNMLARFGGEEELSFIGKPGDARQLQKALCFFLADAIKAKVGEQFDKLYPEQRYPADGPEGGMTVEQRMAAVNELVNRHVEINAELAQIERQVAQLKGTKP